MEITQSLSFKNANSKRKSAARKRMDIHFGDRVFYYILKACAWGVVGLLFLMIGLLAQMSWPA
ncbi:MAG: hypothetical protein AAF202_13270, partial [Pseudomonadota bacterium]